MSLILDGSNGITFPNSSTQAVGFYGFKNRIINGAMVIDQRNAGASTTPTASGYYSCDRWYAQLSVASKYSIQQNAGSVTPPAGFTNYLGITSTSAYSISSSDQFNINQRIEGFNIGDLGWGTANAKTVTLSFQVYSSLTGTFGGAITNSSVDRSYPFSYTISSANTWTTVSITVAGDTTGTWVTNNGIGIRLYINLGAGSTLSGTAGSWAGATYTSCTGATSVVGTNGATFYITGVQLEAGSTATSFDYRPYGTELALCQRYCFVQGYAQASGAYCSIGVGVNQSTTAVSFDYFLPVPMRTTPSLTWTTATYSDINSGASGTVISSNNPRSGPTQLFLQGTYTSGTATAGSVAFLNMVNSTTWQATFSAEL
jgi:hypothetical protein